MQASLHWTRNKLLALAGGVKCCRMNISIFTVLLMLFLSFSSYGEIDEFHSSGFVSIEVTESLLENVTNYFGHFIESDHQVNGCSHAIESRNKCGELKAVGAYCQIDDESIPKTVGLCIAIKTRRLIFYELKPEDRNLEKLIEFSENCLKDI